MLTNRIERNDNTMNNDACDVAAGRHTNSGERQVTEGTRDWSIVIFVSVIQYVIDVSTSLIKSNCVRFEQFSHC